MLGVDEMEIAIKKKKCIKTKGAWSYQMQGVFAYTSGSQTTVECDG